MKRGRKSQWERWRSIAVIPAIVVILMIVIVFADHGKGEVAVVSETTETEQLAVFTEKETQGAADIAVQEESESETETESEISEQGSQEAETVSETTEAVQEKAWLQQDAVPEIVTLMETYFQARASADAESIQKLYGVSDTSAEELEEEKTRLRSNSKYVHKFDAVTIYVGEGLREGEWLVYTTTEICFFSVKTAAPMIMWCYVKTDADGNYYLVDGDTLSMAEKQFVEEKNYSEEVRRLASDINGRLKEALNTDEELNAVYGVLRDGSPVYQEEEQEIVISMEAKTTAESE